MKSFVTCAMLLFILLFVGVIAGGSNSEHTAAQEKTNPTCVSDAKLCKDIKEVISKHKADGYNFDIHCQVALDKVVIYGKPQWEYPSFAYYRDDDDYLKTGAVEIIDKTVRIQNQYGAYARRTVGCKIDINTGKVLVLSVDGMPLSAAR